MQPAESNRPKCGAAPDRSGRQVIKIGGHEIDDPLFLEQLVDLVRGLPVAPILVHGGGKEITEWQDRLGLKPVKIQGLRVTDADSLRLTEMILSGLVNKRLVRMMALAGIRAIGISGVDGHLCEAEKLRLPDADLGFVGTVSRVNTGFIVPLLDAGYLPVISPLSLGRDGQVYNVNADTVAQALAEALQVATLVFITDVPGVKIGGEVVDLLPIGDVDRHITSGEITGGMIPKVRAAVGAVQKGVGSVMITHARNFIEGKGTRIQ